jgi:D-sedoheptulose 7-phosphate isomerase
MTGRQTISNYLEETKRIADKISAEEILKAVEIIYLSKIQGGMVYLCGNGGSASTASHMACDLLKLGYNVHCLNDNPAMITAITNDSGFQNLYSEQIFGRITEYDTLIVFSVHGGTGKDKAGVWSTNLTSAVEHANAKGAKTIGLLGYNGGMIKTMASVSIVVGNSTPQTESWHLHIEHLICELLKEKK